MPTFIIDSHAALTQDQMDQYLEHIITVFRSAGDPDQAAPMKAYMKHRFEFLGIKSPERKALSKPFLTKTARPPAGLIWPLIKDLWILPEREFQYFSMELLAKYTTEAEKWWIDQYEYLITTRSWWDTVDFIAANLAGPYFKKYPDQIRPVTGKWIESGHIWLQRSCLLFQLKYGEDTDTALLAGFIGKLAREKEFFIAKAIGWSLRQYSKYDPEWVFEFIHSHQLQPLSRKEGLKIISSS